MDTKEDREKRLFGGDDTKRHPPERQRQEEEKKSKAGKILRNVFLGLLGVCLFVILGFYITGIVHFKDRFLWNTSINGVDVSGLTVTDVEQMVSDKVASYSLTIEERGQKKEVITASEIAYHYVSNGEVQAFKDSQKVYLWPLSYVDAMSFTFDSGVQYEETLLKERIDALECLDKEKSIAPKDAYIDYLDGTYLVMAEVEGNLLDREKTENLIRESVEFGNVLLSLEKKNCYMIPGKRQNDEGLLSTAKILNQYVSTDIIYLFGSHTEQLNKEKIHTWLSFDEEGKVELDEAAVKEFVRELASTYDTADRPRQFVTNSGRTVTVEGGYYGWVMDQEGETAELLELIKNGTKGNRYALFAQTAVSWENSDLGDSYVEIDLSGQHVWLYIDGEVTVSTDCVSGSMNHADRVTPPGTYTLYYKESPSVLKGENNEYEQKVTYWMPFNGGIGLHDASWRSSFGGTIYKTGGSHGCINLPTEAARKIYEQVYDGIPIICYY